MSGVKITVANLDRSIDFYSRVLGLKVGLRLNAGPFEEVIMASEGCTPVILVQHSDGVADIIPPHPTTLVFFVSDPATYIQRIRDFGLPILMEAKGLVADENSAAGLKEVNGVVAGLGTDPDGHIIEVIDAADSARMERVFTGPALGLVGT